MGQCWQTCQPSPLTFFQKSQNSPSQALCTRAKTRFCKNLVGKWIPIAYGQRSTGEHGAGAICKAGRKPVTADQGHREAVLAPSTSWQRTDRQFRESRATVIVHARESDIASGVVSRGGLGRSQHTALPAHAMVRIFSTEAKVRKWLESAIWLDSPVRPHCGSKRAFTRQGTASA